MRFLLLQFFLFLTVATAYPQIMGLSASKLATLCSEPVPYAQIEFEPSYGFSRVKIHDHEISLSSSLGLRFSYGAIQNIEVGMFVPLDLKELNFGVKAKIFEHKRFSSSIISGIKLPSGNRLINPSERALQDMVALQIGSVFSFAVNDRLSIDADIQFQDYLKTDIQDHLHNYFINLDFGYYIKPKFQLVSGFNYALSAYPSDNEYFSVLVFQPGFTLESAKNFIIAIGLPHDIYCLENQRSTGFAFALTILIN